VLTSGAATITLSADRTTVTLARGDTQLLVFAADAFQVGTVDDLDSGDSFDPYWLYADTPPEPPAGLAWHEARRLTLVKADDTEIVVSTGDAEVLFQPAPDDAFSLVVTSKAERTAYVQVGADADASEGFYGLGEWPDVVNHRGQLRPMQMELDTRYEGADNEDHVPVPLLIGTRGWGMFASIDHAGVFDVARASDTRITTTWGADGLQLKLYTADAPLDVLKAYYDDTGYPGLPAPWALGPLLWRDENRDQAQVLDDIQQIRSRHLATTGVWFDRPYATGVETFDWSAAKFPDPPAMLQALHDAGLRYGIWQTPYTGDASSQDPAPAQRAYAMQHGFFPPQTGVLVNPWGEPIDFTNGDAYNWWQQNLRAYTDAGVEGFKLDYAEDVVVGVSGRRTPWTFHDGSSERTMHRGYQLLYHRLHRELLPAEGGLLLTRTGRWGEQGDGMIIWPGDLDASFAHAGDPIAGQSTLAVGGLPAAVTKGIGLSASGFPFYASDTGGYRHSPPGREVWLRWVEASAVMPAMEVGDSSSQMPWEFTPENGRDQAALDTYARYASLHLRLYPYTWTYAQQMATTGRPIQRPLGLAYPSLGVHPTDEYALGDSLVVAPIVEAGQTSRSVVLPPGEWLSWWDGSVQTGTITAPADIATLPLYLARGAIIPMLRPTIETLSPVTDTTIDSFASDAGVLYVRVAPGPASSFTVHDGTQLAQAPGSVSYTPGAVFDNGVMFEVIATAQPSSVGTLTQQASLAALEAATDGWFWEPGTGGTLWIKIAAGTVTF
jgi:alpha-D-xyloside xylohydrolase